MPFWFTLAIFFAVVAIAAGAFWAFAHRIVRKATTIETDPREATEPSPAGRQPHNLGYDSDYGRHSRDFDQPLDFSGRMGRSKTVLGWTAIGTACFALLLMFISSATIVSTKNVGITTSFGRPIGTLSNGFHLVAPWEKVSEMDAAIQTDSHTQADKNTCITVRIAHQTTACVDASIRWHIVDKQADYLFQNYRGFDNVRDSLVTRELNAALNGVLENYDPLAVDAKGNSTSPTLVSLSAAVTAQMQREIGDKITVLNVIVPVLHFQPDTQNRINALQAQIAQTRIAQQSEVTANAQALANKALAASVSNDPNVLVSKCYDLVNEMISKGIAPPVNFNCWPGSSSAVVIPSVTKTK